MKNSFLRKTISCFLAAAMIAPAILTGTSAVSAADTATEDMVLWYQMDEIKDGRIEDASGNQLDGVVLGDIAAADGMRGQALSFDGSGDYIEIPNLGASLKELNDFTITTFVYLDANQNFQRVFDFGVGQTGSFMCLTPNNNNDWCKGIAYSISNSGGGEENEKGVSYDSSLGLKEWKHLTVRQSGETASLYVDGELAAESTCVLSPADLEESTLNYIGRSLWNDPYFKGRIDDFRIYDRALTTTEIDEIAHLSDEETVIKVKETLSILGSDNAVTNLTLPASEMGADIRWKSGDPAIIADDGTLDRSSVTESVVVIMTATITKGDATATAEIPVTVIPVLTDSKLQAFDLNEVVLSDGVFKDVTEVNTNVIDSMSADTILYAFRYNANTYYGANFTLSGSALGGWAAPNHVFAGHFEGHYMTAASMLYAQNQDAALKEKLIAIVDGLEEVQNSLTKAGSDQPVGYLSAFPETRFDTLEAGQISSVPWYMIHKIMQGLIDVYRYTGYEKALTVAEKLADWTEWRTGRLTYEEMQKVLAFEEYGGMQEVLINLSTVTGNEEYMEIADRFVQKELLMDPLYEGEDNLIGFHGNTYLAKIVATAADYNATGDDYYRIITENFWDFVVDGRTYVTGGNSIEEHFTEAHKISENLYGNTCETCNIYNMLKITKEIFTWTGDSRYADYYEKALFNQILGSINVTNGDKTYFQYMQLNTTKVFNSNRNGNFCCNASGLESFAKLADSIYFHTEDAVYVNQFIASALNWSEKEFAMEQTTTFPLENKSVLKITQAGSGEVTLNIRVPSWSEGGITVTVNGEKQQIAANAKGYAAVTRQWAVGDTVEITMNMQFGLEATTDNESVAAFTYGPIAMVGVGYQEDGGNFYIPYKSDSAEAAEQFVITDEATLTSTLTSANGKEITFMPFYKVQSETYTTYWTFTELELPAFAENVALGKSVEADESYSADYDAAKAVDGNLGTRWCVKGWTENHWLTVDLGDVYYISSMIAKFEQPGNFRFRLYYSMDGEDWQFYADKSERRSAAVADYAFSGNGYGQYVKFEYLSSDNNAWCSLWELEVYGSKLKEVETLQVTGQVGKAIELPTSVSLTFEDGQKADADIAWAEDVQTVYDAAGTYTINGVVSNLEGEIPVTATVTIAVAEPYTDVTEGDWFYDVVCYNYAKGYMTGKDATTFAPDATLTRAELTSILYRINGEPEVTYEAVFTDVPADAWYASPVLWAYENKVVSGYAEGDFKPDNAITREQLAVIMHNYAAAKGYGVDSSADLDAFNDAAQVSDWAKPAVQWAVGAGVISGKDGVSLDPQGNATRAEAAAIIQRFMENIAK